MGYHTYSDVCNNVLHFGDAPEFVKDLKLGFQKYIDEYYDEDESEDCSFEIAKGWSSFGETKCGINQNLYAEELIKQNFKVYIINSSPHRCVGGYDFYVCSDDLSAVEEFLNDFRDNSCDTEIKPIASVMCTI